MTLQRIETQRYSQGKYFKEGVCFRLSFKWAALTMLGGNFNFHMDSQGLNIGKTKTKFNSYYAFSDGELADKTRNWNNSKVFADWVADDVLNAMNYINQWGVRITDKKTVYGGVTVDKLIDGNASNFLANYGASAITFIYGYYGYDKGEPAAHATAYSNGQYFDPNFGVYRSDATTPAGIGQDIDSFIARKESSWTQQNFIIFVLSAENAKAISK